MLLAETAPQIINGKTGIRRPNDLALYYILQAFAVILRAFPLAIRSESDNFASVMSA